MIGGRDSTEEKKLVEGTLPGCRAAEVLSCNNVRVIGCSVVGALVVAVEWCFRAQAAARAGGSGSFKANLDPALLGP